MNYSYQDSLHRNCFVFHERFPLHFLPTNHLERKPEITEMFTLFLVLGLTFSLHKPFVLYFYLKMCTMIFVA